MILNKFVVKAIKEKYKIEITHCCEFFGEKFSSIYMEIKNKDSFVYLDKSVMYDKSDKIKEISEFIKDNIQTHNEMSKENYYKRNFYRTIYIALDRRSMFGKDDRLFGYLEEEFGEKELMKRLRNYIDEQTHGNMNATFGEVYKYCLKNFIKDQSKTLEKENCDK